MTSEPLRDDDIKKPAFSDEELNTEEPNTEEPNTEEPNTEEPIEEPDMDDSNIDSDMNIDKEKSSSFDVFNILTEMVKSRFE